MFAPASFDPSARLKALEELRILDTPSEQPYEDVVDLVCHIFDVPMATVTLLDRHRQWFKAKRGLACDEGDIESAFCRYPVASGKTLIVENALLDERFKDNVLVTGEPFIRFYAGAPVYADGVAVGTVCAIDYRPRTADPEKIALLEALARQVGELLSLRKTSLRLARTEARLEAFMAHAPIAAYIKDEEGRYLYMSPFGEAAYQADPTGTLDADWIDSGTLCALRDHEELVWVEDRPIRREFRTTLADGAERDWSVVKFPFDDPAGGRLLGAVAHDITLQKDAERQLNRFLAASRDYAERLEDSNCQLERLAATDELTGLANHKAFQSELASRVSAGGFTLLTLEVEGLDALGRNAGGSALLAVAEVLCEQIGHEGFVGRLGDDGFGAILEGVSAHEVRDAADRIRLSVEAGHALNVSVGVATCEFGDTRESLLGRSLRSLDAGREARTERLAAA